MLIMVLLVAAVFPLRLKSRMLRFQVVPLKGQELPPVSMTIHVGGIVPKFGQFRTIVLSAMARQGLFFNRVFSAAVPFLRLQT